MKISITILASLALCLVASGTARSESIHQTAQGEVARTSGGADAAAQKLIEIKDLPSGEKVARLAGSTPQWGFVNYWFGLPTPAGQTTLRVKVWVGDEETGSYAFYIKKEGSEPIVKKFEIPADAPKGSFVTIEIPVDMPQEWNGLALKKIAASDKPGPWIDSISVVLK